jgi:hypothetical protein
MVAGGTNSNTRGRGTARKIVTGRTLPKRTVAPYKADRVYTGRTRSKSRAKSLEDSQEHREDLQEDLEMEETQKDTEPKMLKDNPNRAQTPKNQPSASSLDKGKGREVETGESREVLRKIRYRAEIKTSRSYEGAKELLETIKFSLCAFPSFLGAHVVKKQEDLKIVTEFGDETQMQESLQIRFDNGDHPSLQQVSRTDQEIDDQRGVIVRDIPLNTHIGTVKGILSRYGKVEDIKIKLVGMWQTATVIYQEQEDARDLAKEWAIPFEKEYVRILPLENHRRHNEERCRYVLKLAGLTRGTTAFDLSQVKEEVNAKTIYIPRREWDYERERHAFMSFESNEDYKQAMDKTYTIGRQTARLVTEHAPVCYRCGDSTHLSYECAERRVGIEKQAAIERFAAVQEKFSNRHGEKSSYAEALKRNTSRNRRSRQEASDTATVNKTNKETPMEDRILDLEIKMTTMQNLLMKIADKIRYWEEIEETEEAEEQEPMDTESIEDTEKGQHSNTPQRTEPKQPQQESPQDPKKRGDQEKTEDNIRARQEKLEDNMREMMEILGKIAGKFERHNNAAQKPGQEGGTADQVQ